METMQTLLLVLQVVVAITLIGFILIQHGKGADAGAAFGSGASATVFGSRGSGGFLTRATTVLAIIFLANSLVLGYIASNTTGTQRSLLEQESVVLDQLPEDKPAAQDGENTNSGDMPAGLSAVQEGAREETTQAPVSDIPAIPKE